jgi:cyanophycinase
MSEKQSERELSAPVASAPARRPKQGPVMPIGGAEDADGDGDEAILERFVELAGGAKARIALVPTASSVPDEMTKKYQKVFKKLGASSIEVVEIEQREDANGEQACAVIREATGIFITGGDQARLVSLLAGTKTMEEIRLCNARGAVVAGTSAGASILAAHMMVGGTGLAGNSNDAAARKAMVELVSGFGLLQDVIIDQHFSCAGRPEREARRARERHGDHHRRAQCGLRLFHAGGR